VRSSEGLYFSKLDQVRALAAFLVFNWHFGHLTEPFPLPVTGPAPFPLSIFHEGHTGVALFMVLSGYLFAKIVGQRSISFPLFLYNRVLRLGPLLLVSFGLAWVLARYGIGTAPKALFRGLIYPTWPGGSWSVTVELHFYLLFALLLWFTRRISPLVLLLVVAVAVGGRWMYWSSHGTVKLLSYLTIYGRIDQFVLGMFVALFPLTSRQRNWFAAVALTGFALFWRWFDADGGFYNFGDKAWIWVIIPTVEGIAYAAFIAWYDGLNYQLPHWLDRPFARIGEWSYSIYLLHFFFFFAALVYLKPLLPEMGFWTSIVFSILCLVLFLPVAAASYYWIERPFLRFRVPYIKRAARPAPVLAEAARPAASNG
jgi:peptidoglycan/LPS O-acetylase OafA/YrhL